MNANIKKSSFKKGIYVLIIELLEDKKIKIGALGFVSLKKGNYAYIGSAQNNIKRRIERHKKNNKKKHWHIDYLLLEKKALLKAVYSKEKEKSEECKTAAKLLKEKKSFTPILKFGCSDCSCPSHLFKVRTIKRLKEIFKPQLIENIKDLSYKLKSQHIQKYREIDI